MPRSIDYLETRQDIDPKKVAYYGFSWGGVIGTIIPAVEERLKVVILVLGGFSGSEALPEAGGLNYVSRISALTLMLNGRYHVYELSSGTFTRFPFEDGDERTPVWTPDGMRLVYTSEPGPVFQMFLQSVNGTSRPEPIFRNEYPRYPCSFSPDGETLAFVENHPMTGWDIWTGFINGKETTHPYLQTGHFESYPAFSLDGKWMAYQSDKSG